MIVCSFKCLLFNHSKTSDDHLNEIWYGSSITLNLHSDYFLSRKNIRFLQDKLKLQDTASTKILRL